MKLGKPLVDEVSEFSSALKVRYARHVVIPGIGLSGQKRLANAKVLCIGAGGLGSPVLLYLAAAGVGTLGIVDHDLVDESNLQRQIIHGEADIGSPKTHSAKERIHEINSAVKINIYSQGINRENALEIISDYDVVVDATDNFATRYLINDACVLLKKPCVWGSIYRFDGQASVFFSTVGPCYRCLHPEPPAKELAPNCAVGGVFGVLCATIGSVQATETIKLITGVGEVIVGELLIYDALDSSFEKITLKKDPTCPICSTNPTQTGLMDDYDAFCSVSLFEKNEFDVPLISASGLQELLASGTNFQLVDVREPDEWEEGIINPALLLPQGEFYSGAAVTQLSQENPIILYCKSGQRSANCAVALTKAGFKDVASLDGGMIAWDALQV
jgi:adenylyltransferase/sulfurtransferase